MVLELVAVTPLAGGTERQRVGCGWGFFPLFSHEADLPDSGSGAAVPTQRYAPHATVHGGGRKTQESYLCVIVAVFGGNRAFCVSKVKILAFYRLFKAFFKAFLRLFYGFLKGFLWLFTAFLRL